jgi:hypothetical protein
MITMAKPGRFTFGVSCLLAVLLTGCSTLVVPKYIRDSHPYEKVLYSDYDNALATVREVLKAMGWDIVETADPAVYEHYKELTSAGRQQVLLFTNVRTGYYIFGARYHRVNVYLREITTQTTSLEIRYMTVLSALSRTFYGYRKDGAVKKMIGAIERGLPQSGPAATGRF